MGWSEIKMRIAEPEAIVLVESDNPGEKQHHLGANLMARACG
jgi:hypothetical protein